MEGNLSSIIYEDSQKSNEENSNQKLEDLINLKLKNLINLEQKVQNECYNYLMEIEKLKNQQNKEQEVKPEMEKPKLQDPINQKQESKSNVICEPINWFNLNETLEYIKKKGGLIKSWLNSKKSNEKPESDTKEEEKKSFFSAFMGNFLDHSIGIYGRNSDDVEMFYDQLLKIIPNKIPIYLYSGQESIHYKKNEFVILLVQLYVGRTNFSNLYDDFANSVLSKTDKSKFIIMVYDTYNDRETIVKNSNGDLFAKKYKTNLFSQSESSIKELISRIEETFNNPNKIQKFNSDNNNNYQTQMDIINIFQDNK